MKKIIKSDKFTYSWMMLCNTAFGWTAQIKNESLKTIVICSIVFLSAIVFAWVSFSKGKSEKIPIKRGKRKIRLIKGPDQKQSRKNIAKYS